MRVSAQAPRARRVSPVSSLDPHRHGCQQREKLNPLWRQQIHTCGRSGDFLLADEPHRTYISLRTEMTDESAIILRPVARKFILHWGEMGTRWGINRTVAQIDALLFVSPRP